MMAGLSESPGNDEAIHSCKEVLVCSAFCGKEIFKGGVKDYPPRPYLVRKDKGPANIKPKFVKK